MSKELGSAAAGREDKKVDKYSNLSDYYYIFCSRCEKLSTFYLFQSISIAIQKSNAQCITGCVKEGYSGLEGLSNFHVQEAEEL